jgi:hypothetical protein
MLEGQVAILSSGLLGPAAALDLLENLRHSALYRADQHSYILYPDRPLPGFLEKNRIDPDQAARLALVQALAAAGDSTLVTRDLDGVYHFSGKLRNLKDVNQALQALGRRPEYAALVQAEAAPIRALFEATFRHSEFTGRSGTFFAYEGLGSIYWHMVSKLLLATQEAARQAQHTPGGEGLARALVERYRDIRLGLGFNKAPQVYGAFPTDPYSHTPKGQGARQPGMTGQVKEEILARQAELGLFVRDGRLVFDPFLLDPAELLETPQPFTWVDVDGRLQTIAAPAGGLAYTFCQVPVVMRALLPGEENREPRLELTLADGQVVTLPGSTLDLTNSALVMQRSGQVQSITVYFIPTSN